MAFKAIETQEEFEVALKDRLAQNERSVSERFKGWLAPDAVQELKDDYEKTIADFKEKAATHETTVAELTQRATKAEHTLLRQQVAASKGIPIELASRLVGETKETLEKDADSFAAYLGPKTAPPMRSTEPTQVNDKQAAMTQVLGQLFANNN